MMFYYKPAGPGLVVRTCSDTGEECGLVECFEGHEQHVADGLNGKWAKE